MLANEVLDVMPVKLFVKRGSVTFERGVVIGPDGGFAFDERRASDALASAVAAIEAEHGALPDGYASEVNLLAEGWMRSSAQWLRAAHCWSSTTDFRSVSTTTRND